MTKIKFREKKKVQIFSFWHLQSSWNEAEENTEKQQKL